MSQSNWQILPQPDSKQVQALVDQLNIAAFTAGILVQRGIDTPEQALAFLRPNVNQLHSPFEFHDMDVAVERIQAAAFGGEKIVVYGDYDLDGMTSTTIMVEALEILGADVTAYIPNRFQDGYGPNLDRYQELVAKGTQLIITVDNGVSGNAAIEYAQNKGVDVVITDHHALPLRLPPAYAIVHPRHPQGAYPFADLSGAGVAFKVTQALLNEDQPVVSWEDLPVDFLDLVALGEIADMVSLAGENRALVSQGLKQLSMSPRPGIQALLKAAKHASQEPVTAETVAFKIAPRLNAVGRIADAQLGVDLLRSDDLEQAKKLATQVEALNDQRREIVEEVFAASKQIALQADFKDQGVLIVAGQGWHQGILGIVASRLVDLLEKPVVVLSEVDGIYKGSGRSFGDFDLHQFMSQYQDLYLNFGGHAGALGLSVDPARLADLQKQVAQGSRDLKLVKTPVAVTAVLKTTTLTTDLYRQLSILEPFGVDNPQPVFEFDQPRVLAKTTMGATQQHLKLKLPGMQQPIEAVGFNHPDWVQALEKQPLDSFIASLGLNYFRGQENLQLLLSDLTVQAPEATAQTGNHKVLFARVYKFIVQHQDLNFAQNISNVAGQLNLTVMQVKLVLQVFVELDFVTIQTGYVIVNHTADKKSLSASPSYRKYLQNN